MDALNETTLRHLAETEASACVSLLMPTYMAGRDTAQNAIRFKNLLQQAEREMEQRGIRSPDARNLLQPARKLAEDSLFWTHQDAGLAVYLTPSAMHAIRVPSPLPERVTVGGHFYLVPLLPIAAERGRFYILALSPKGLRLLEAFGQSVQEVEVPGGPKSLEELTELIDAEKQLQFHTGAAPGKGHGGRAAVFHGHPGGEDQSEHKLRLFEYCRLIDQRLHEVLDNSTVPLVLACDKRLAPIYAQANTYAGLLDAFVEGSPDRKRPEELAAAARPLVDPDRTKADQRAVSRFEAASAEGRAGRKLEEVVRAAAEGRVEELLVADDGSRWGRWLDAEHRLEIHDQPQPEDEDLLNLAAVWAHRQGATVHVMPRQAMPEGCDIAAVYRF